MDRLGFLTQLVLHLSLFKIKNLTKHEKEKHFR